jgi:hypothetical protein
MSLPSWSGPECLYDTVLSDNGIKYTFDVRGSLILGTSLKTGTGKGRRSAEILGGTWELRVITKLTKILIATEGAALGH